MKMTQTCARVIFMTEDESHASNPLIADFILLGQKLAKLGFIYHRGAVTSIELTEHFYC